MGRLTNIVFVWNFLQIFQNNFLGISTLTDVHIEVPQAVFDRDTVCLVCKYDLEQAALYSIKWYFRDEEFYRFVPKESPPTRIFPLQHFNVDIQQSNEEQVCLRQVSPEQTGLYKCEISADAPLFHTEILSSHMTVILINQFESPILSTEITKAEIGRKIRLNCSAPASKPASNLTWFINDKMVTSSHKNDVTVTQLPAIALRDRIVTRSRFQTVATADKFINGQITITCQACIYDVFAKNVTSHILEFLPHFQSVSIDASGSSNHNDKTMRPSSTIAFSAAASCMMTSTSVFVKNLFLLSFIFLVSRNNEIHMSSIF